MKIAVFGGSFNPVHIGHAILADTVIKELGFDKVLFVPAYKPPHKIMNNDISAKDRLKMLELFCLDEGSGRFEVESCEIDRGGISYTCDTLEYLTNKYKNVLEGKLSFIMGDEVASDFDKWKNPEKIAQLADFIITHRYPDVAALENRLFDNVPTGEYQRDFKVKFDLEKFKYPCTYLEKPLFPVSSTEIRTRVSENSSYRFLVPKVVFEYIEEKGLYK